MSDNSAAASGIGYYYQYIYSLYLLLEQYEPHIFIRIEGHDDIELLEKNELQELFQIKHHENHNVSLSNRNLDLWKTIGIWSELVKKNWISVPDTRLNLFTTAKVSDNSIPSLLRPDFRRNSQLACKQLQEEAVSCKLTGDALQKLSENIPKPILEKLRPFENLKYPSEEAFWEDLKNKSKSIKGIERYKQLILDHTKATRELQKAFDHFMNLSQEQQENLVESIQILDSSDNIIETQKKLENILHGINLEDREEALRELLGWWLEIVIEHLHNGSKETISKAMVENYIAFIRQDKCLKLPDYELPSDFDPLSIKWEDERFVRQLRIIDAKESLRKIAIRNYMKTIVHRTRWEKDGRISFKRIEEFQEDLKDWWEIIWDGLENKFENEYGCKIDELNEEHLKKFGKDLYNEILRCDKKIKDYNTRDYITQGSYHELANNIDLETNKPHVYWHPKFSERDKG